MNNNTENYIKFIRFPNKKCKISIISNNKESVLNKTEAMTMYRILKKFPFLQINENTFIFPDYDKILAIYDELIKKNTKSKPKKVNRNKSKNIVINTITAGIILSLAVSGISIYKGYKNEKQQEEMLEMINDNSSNLEILTQELLDNSNTQKIILEQDEINEPIKYDISAETIEYEENFSYYFEKIGDKGALENAKQYEDIFIKYEQMYGIDKDLLCAIAAQESSGIHKDYSENGCALGLMGIENYWKNKEIEIYNFNLGGTEIIKIDYNRVGEDVDYNIKVGAAIYQDNFNKLYLKNKVPNNELLAYITQTYNMGMNNIQKLHKTGMHWIDSRNIIEEGDEQYFEHVFSRLDNNTVINIKLINGETFSTKISNEALKIKSKSFN